MKLHDLNLATRATIGVLAIVVAGVATLLLVENARLQDAYLSERRVHLEQDIRTEELRLNQTISALSQDVLFLANTPPVSGIVRASLNHGYDSRYGNTDKVWKERLQQIFSAFSRAHPDYYQIRYIGMSDGGREIVRVDHRGGKIEITPPDRLQAKGDRDYLKAALGLREGQVSLSEFNLNQEPGVIEQSYRPTLRATTPVLTPSGEFFGMVVISLSVDKLLKSAVSDLPGVQTYVANSDGQYLLHPDAQQAFKFEPGHANKVVTDFPFIASMFNPQAKDYQPLHTVTTKTDNSLFTARQVHFDPGEPQRFLLLMHYLPGAAVTKQIASIPAKIIFYELVVVLLVGGAATFVLRRTFSPLKQITLAANNIAAGDQNTLLPPAQGGEIGSLTNSLNTMLAKLLQREKLLRECEARYCNLHESMVDAYVKVDMSGRFLEFNHTYLEMLGYTAEELQRLTCVNLTPKKWHDLEARIVEEQVIPLGYSQVYEKEYVRKGGAVFPVELRVFLLRDANNQPDAMWAIVRDITERKQAEELLRKSSAEIGDLYNHAPCGYHSLGKDGEILMINDTELAWLGYERDEVIGKMKYTDLLASASQEVFRKKYARLMKQGFIHDIEIEIICKSGAVFTGLINATASYDSSGNFMISRSTVTDITERKQMEILKRQFDGLLQGSLNEIYFIDAESMHFLLVSEGAKNNLGYSLDELGQLALTDINPSLAQDEFEQMVANLKIGEHPSLHIKTFFRRKDVTTYPVEGVLQLIDGKHPVLLAIFQDTTESKQAEESLHKASAEIEYLYNHAPCGYHSLDKDGDILMINDTELMWLGYTRDEVIGKKKYTDLLTSASIQVFHETSSQLMKLGFISNIELELIRKDGTMFSGLVNATAIYDPIGNYVMSRSTVTNITAHKFSETMLAESYLELQRVSAHLENIRESERDKIARDLHNEMGSLLVALKMRVDWLESKLPADMPRLTDEAGHISRLVADSICSMQQAIARLRPSLLGESGFAQAVKDYITKFRTQTGIECVLVLPDEELTLDTSKSNTLYRILQESLSNVSKYARAGRVSILFTKCADSISMVVEDNGVGFDTSATRKQSFGLVGIRERAFMVGGKARIGSKPGVGTRVSVTIPIH